MLVPLTILIGALAQSVSGIGFVLVSGPALVALLGPTEGVALALLLSSFVSISVLVRDWRAVGQRAPSCSSCRPP
jgi:uncharacterized protein